MKIILSTFLLLVLFACGENVKENVEIVKIDESPEVIPTPTIIEATTTTYTNKTIFSPENGWGYQILKNNDLFINQPHIPSIQGISGFESEEKAQITADYILNKLNNNIFPPTISPEELDSLGVL